MNESTDTTAAPRSDGRAAKLKQRIKQDGKEKIESGKRAAADQIEELADAIDVAGLQLDQSQPTLANFASKLATGVGGLATRLREDSIEDIYGEVRRLATRHPGMFLLGSAALGIVIARFMKVSGEGLSGEDLAGEGLANSSDDEDDGGDWQSSRQGSQDYGDVSAPAYGQYGQEDNQRRDVTPDPYGSPATGA